MLIKNTRENASVRNYIKRTSSYDLPIYIQRSWVHNTETTRFFLEFKRVSTNHTLLQLTLSTLTIFHSSSTFLYKLWTSSAYVKLQEFFTTYQHNRNLNLMHPFTDGLTILEVRCTLTKSQLKLAEATRIHLKPPKVTWIHLKSAKVPCIHLKSADVSCNLVVSWSKLK